MSCYRNSSVKQNSLVSVSPVLMLPCFIVCSSPSNVLPDPREDSPMVGRRGVGEGRWGVQCSSGSQQPYCVGGWVRVGFWGHCPLGECLPGAHPARARRATFRLCSP